MTNVITVSIPHQLTRAEAKRRIQDQVVKFREQQHAVAGGIRDSWHGDTMDFTLDVMGQSLSGRLFVEEHAVRLEVALPWFLNLLAGAVRQEIEYQGRQLLGGPPSR